MLLMSVKEKGRLRKTERGKCVFLGQEELGKAYNPLGVETSSEWLNSFSHYKQSWASINHSNHYNSHTSKCLHVLSLSTEFNYINITMCFHTRSLSTEFHVYIHLGFHHKVPQPCLHLDNKVSFLLTCWHNILTMNTTESHNFLPNNYTKSNHKI